MLGIPAAFWSYYLREEPDVKWSISAAISFPQYLQNTNAQKQKNDFIQQIEVANSGNEEAKDIVIKLPHNVTQYNITKNKSNDRITETKTQNATEIIYNDLPPAGGYQITMMTSGSPLNANQIDISHKRGKARLVSPSTNTNPYSYAITVLSILFPLIYLVLVIQSLRDFLKYQLIFSKYSKNINDLLSIRCPWYIPSTKWPQLQFDLLSQKLEETPGTYYSISQSVAYSILSTHKPTALLEGDWDKLKAKASQLLILHAEKKAQTATNKSEIIDILNTNLPNGISEEQKDQFLQKISHHYIDLALETTQASELSNILLQDQKPGLLTSKAWEKFKGKALAVVLDNIRTEIISSNGIREIESMPIWEILSNNNRYALNNLNNATLDTKNIAAERAELMEKQSKLASTISDLNIREIQLELNEQRIREKRSKVERQLDAIDHIINDPEYLERIEPDNDLFTQGNWNLLRKLINSRK